MRSFSSCSRLNKGVASLTVTKRAHLSLLLVPLKTNEHTSPQILVQLTLDKRLLSSLARWSLQQIAIVNVIFPKLEKGLPILWQSGLTTPG